MDEGRVMEGSLEYRVIVHEENGGFWAEVAEIPGCFASGDTMDELRDALEEAMSMCLTVGTSKIDVKIHEMAEVENEYRVCVDA